ncbi:MAG: hypothetical protein J5586_06165 [Clostridia bacterium]|nr:hypothetical protein [Clostridia bacterium]
MIQILKNKKRIAALMLAALLVSGLFTACRLDGKDPEVTAAPTAHAQEDPPAVSTVVMRSKNVDLTLYDFGQGFYNSQYFQYYMYGLIDPGQFCDAVVEELSGLMYALNAAIDDGMKLTQEETDEISEMFSDQLEELLDRYETEVPEDAADRRAAAKALLEEDLAEDGIDFEQFIELAENNMKLYKLVTKFYEKLESNIDVQEDEIRDYIAEQLESTAEASMSDIAQLYSAFSEGSGAYPVSFSDDCFSVDHIYLELEAQADEEGNVEYIKDSRAADEARIEELLPTLADYDAFMALEEELGEDPGMDIAGYRENGYLMHPDLENDYFDGFVYAAMNLRLGEWHSPRETSEEDPYTPPEIEFFTLLDGTRVVKVFTDSGIHYIIVNKEIKKGPVEYSVGDEHWNSWKSVVVSEKLGELNKELMASWKETYEIETDIYSIKLKYAPDSADQK